MINDVARSFHSHRWWSAENNDCLIKVSLKEIFLVQKFRLVHIMMDVDPPNLCSNLKRSCSAPMINILTSQMKTDCLPPRESAPPSPLLLGISRARRFSASFSPNSSPNSTPTSTAPLSPVVPSRVSQIKQEEGMDVMFREAAHEKETQSKLQFSQSWEDLTLDDASLNESSKRPRLTEPLHIFTLPVGTCNSPSPCRTGKQCFSPSTCLPVRTSAFSPTPSPSPTRKNLTSRRSQSPISLRPSQFSLKRKHDMDVDSGDSLSSSAKRLSTENYIPIAHPLIHSLSSSTLEATDSPEQTVPHVCGDITDSMSSCGSSPFSTFKPLDPAPLIQESMEETTV